MAITQRVIAISAILNTFCRYVFAKKLNLLFSVVFIVGINEQEIQ